MPRRSTQRAYPRRVPRRPMDHEPWAPIGDGTRPLILSGDLSERFAISPGVLWEARIVGYCLFGLIGQHCLPKNHCCRSCYYGLLSPRMYFQTKTMRYRLISLHASSNGSEMFELGYRKKSQHWPDPNKTEEKKEHDESEIYFLRPLASECVHTSAGLVSGGVGNPNCWSK